MLTHLHIIAHVHLSMHLHCMISPNWQKVRAGDLWVRSRQQLLCGDRQAHIHRHRLLWKERITCAHLLSCHILIPVPVWEHVPLQLCQQFHLCSRETGWRLKHRLHSPDPLLTSPSTPAAASLTHEQLLSGMNEWKSETNRLQQYTNELP